MPDKSDANLVATQLIPMTNRTPAATMAKLADRSGDRLGLLRSRHSNRPSVIILVYVTSHGFIVLGYGPSALMLVPPAPQC
jgi:hypothetical protein